MCSIGAASPSIHPVVKKNRATSMIEKCSVFGFTTFVRRLSHTVEYSINVTNLQQNIIKSTYFAPTEFVLLLGFLRFNGLLYVQKGGLASGPDDADSSCGKRLHDYVTTAPSVWRGEMQVLDA